MYKFPKYKVAAVQAAPVFLDREATADKVCDFIREAARNGASLVAFPEAFIPGYPQWIWYDAPGDPDRFFARLVQNSVAVPSPTTKKICQAVREVGIYAAVGINESSTTSFGEIFNSLLLIGPDGEIISKHRKIIPTYAEKLVWSFGDGSSLKVHKTELGRVGMLICGENTNSLARYALIAQAEQLHISNYPAFSQKGRYNQKRGVEIRAAAHAFEGKVFTIVASSIISDEMKRLLGNTPEKAELLSNCADAGFTGVIGPNGDLLAGPLADGEEGIVYADVDLEKSLDGKLFHDIAGNYNRFDILSLNLNQRQRRAIRATGAADVMNGSRVDSIKDIINKCGGISDAALRDDIVGLLESLKAQ